MCVYRSVSQSLACGLEHMEKISRRAKEGTVCRLHMLKNDLFQVDIMQQIWRETSALSATIAPLCEPTLMKQMFECGWEAVHPIGARVRVIRTSRYAVGFCGIPWTGNGSAKLGQP